MPATRRSSRVASTSLFPVRKPSVSASPAKKRTNASTDLAPAKKLKLSSSSTDTTPSLRPFPNFNLTPAHTDPGRVIPAILSFDFDRAKAHLIEVDERFRKVFETLPCRPFEELEPVDPFRSLCTSIVGQQVSWLAARAINHRFRRLFDPSLPEKAGVDSGNIQGDKDLFPSPQDVLKLDVTQLKSAGLSGRKAEYVLSLAEHFVSGTLSSRFLAEASVEDVSRALIGVRGIGQWTVDMFLIFTLKRPDILPVGDLGVQKGLLKWVLAAYDHRSAETTDTNGQPIAAGEETIENGDTRAETMAESSVLPVDQPSPVPVDAAVFPPTEPVKQKKAEQKGLEKALLSFSTPPDDVEGMYELPEGMDVGLMRSRLGGKKAKGNVYLTPPEMEVLTRRWAPYRSLGVYYMWAVAEDTG